MYYSIRKKTRENQRKETGEEKGGKKEDKKVKDQEGIYGEETKGTKRQTQLPWARAGF